MNKLFFFGEALKLAKRAGARDEIPIAAVLVKEGKIIARAYNQTEKKKSFLAHAEILCLQKAAKFLKSKYLDGCSLYITLEPCKMCEAAARLSRIESIHFLLRSPKFGRSGVGYHKILRKGHFGAMRDQSAALLADFFQKKR